MSLSFNVDWLVAGDFNEVLYASEKLGGYPINRNRVKHFWNCLQNRGLVDLVFQGQKITWTNKRYRNRTHFIFERLNKW